MSPAPVFAQRQLNRSNMVAGPRPVSPLATLSFASQRGPMFPVTLPAGQTMAQIIIGRARRITRSQWRAMGPKQKAQVVRAALEAHGFTSLNNSTRGEAVYRTVAAIDAMVGIAHPAGQVAGPHATPRAAQAVSGASIISAANTTAQEWMPMTEADKTALVRRVLDMWGPSVVPPPYSDVMVAKLVTLADVSAQQQIARVAMTAAADLYHRLCDSVPGTATGPSAVAAISHQVRAAHAAFGNMYGAPSASIGDKVASAVTSVLGTAFSSPKTPPAISKTSAAPTKSYVAYAAPAKKAAGIAAPFFGVNMPR